MQTFLKLTSNPKMFVSESHFDVEYIYGFVGWGRKQSR